MSNLDSQSIMDRNRIFWSHYLGLRISWDDWLFLSRITSIHNTLARIRKIVNSLHPKQTNKQPEHGTSVGICTCTYSSMHLSTLQVCLVGRVAGKEGERMERGQVRERGGER